MYINQCSNINKLREIYVCNYGANSNNNIHLPENKLILDYTKDIMVALFIIQFMHLRIIWISILFPAVNHAFNYAVTQQVSYAFL